MVSPLDFFVKQVYNKYDEMKIAKIGEFHITR